MVLRGFVSICLSFIWSSPIQPHTRLFQVELLAETLLIEETR